MRRRGLRWAGPLLTAAVVLPPLAWLAVAGIAAIGSPGGPFLDRVARQLFLRSLGIATATALLAAAIGVPYGWALARCRLAGARLLRFGSLLPLLLPSYAGALAWTILLARDGRLNALLLRWGWIAAPLSHFRSLPLTVWVLVSAYWPIYSWLALFAARSVPRELEDAARLHLPGPAAARWAAGPAVRRAAAAAGLMVFLLALADFGVPNSLGLPTYPVEIVNRFQTDRDPGVVVRLALPLLVLVTPLVLLQTRLLDGTPLSTGTGEPLAEVGDPRRAPLRSLLCGAALGATVLLPLGALAAASLPLATYPAVWAESEDHFVNTLITAGGGAVLTALLALLYGWAARDRRRPALDLALTLPYALPASLIGIAAIVLLNRPGPLGELYTSLGGLVWLYAALFYPFAHRALQPAWARIDPELVEDAALHGAGEWAQFRSAAWPSLRPHALLAGGLVAVLAAREIDATALLRIPGGDTVAFRIQDYLHFAPGPNVSALCVILVVLSALVCVLLGALLRMGKD